MIIETYPEACRQVVDAGHEIGHHGWTHMPPAALTREQEEDGLVRRNRAIERLCGRTARGYRSPAWDLSPNTIDLLLAQGFDYDSSMMGDDYTPYRARHGDIAELEKPFVFGATLDDYPHFEFVRTRGTPCSRG